jgi:hypothetical protein
MDVLGRTFVMAPGRVPGFGLAGYKNRCEKSCAQNLLHKQTAVSFQLRKKPDGFPEGDNIQVPC